MNSYSDSHTFRLFRERKVSPFVEGMASLLDPSGSESLYNYDKTGAEADRNSIHADWLQVGDDLRNVMQNYASRQKN